MRLASLSYVASTCPPQMTTKTGSIQQPQYNRWLLGDISMSSAGVEVIVFRDPPSLPTATTEDASEQSFVRQAERFAATTAASRVPRGPRRTPRKSLIVVLPENHVVSPDLVTDRLA